MTGTPFNDDLAGAELMLRDRFESAVGGLTPDIGRLVADGTSEGRGAVRRRRILSGVTAAAVAVVALGSISYASQSDLFGKGDDHATDNGNVVQLVPATPRGLAAALMSHTEGLGTPIAVGGSDGGPQSQDWQLSAQVAYDLDGGAGAEIDVYASPQLALWRSCDDVLAQAGGMSECHSVSLPDGAPAIYIEYSGSNSAQSGSAFAVAIVVKRDDQIVAVLETISGESDLALGQAALAAIAADPEVGISTTPDLNAAGEEIPDFKAGGLITSEGGSSSATATAPPPTPESSAPQPNRSRSTASSSAASN